MSPERTTSCAGGGRDRKDDFLTRYLPSVMANWLLSAVTGVRLHDIGCSLKVFRAEVVKPLRLTPGMHRYLPALASQLGQGRVTEVVVNHRPRRFGASKYGLSRTFRVLGDLFTLRRLMREARRSRPPTQQQLYEVAEVLEPNEARARAVNNTMSYSSPLEARIAKKTTKAITDFNLIEDGDRIMVGLSGGKDSWALLQTLDNLRKRAPIDFSLIAVNVDSGYKDFKHGVIAKTCEERGWEYRIEHTSIGDVMDDILDAGATPCSLCARLRRGVLYRIATEVGATKIALGHHLDDFIETLLLNLFFAGALKAMPARLVSDNGEHVVIRPFAYVGEDEARLYCKEVELPIIGCCCPACGDLEPAAPARQAPDHGSRGRAFGRQAVDAQGARERHAASPPRHASQPERRAARQRGAATRGDGRSIDSDQVLATDHECVPSSSV